MCCCLRNCSWLLGSPPSQSSISGDRVPVPHPADKTKQRKEKSKKTRLLFFCAHNVPAATSAALAALPTRRKFCLARRAAAFNVCSSVGTDCKQICVIAEKRSTFLFIYLTPPTVAMKHLGRCSSIRLIFNGGDRNDC